MSGRARMRADTPEGRAEVVPDRPIPARGAATSDREALS
jgi:hypothetical protein